MNEKLTDFPRMEKDGKVAILYSPGFGAGWSTWCDDAWRLLLVMHKDLVQLVLDGKNGEAGELAEKLIREATGNPKEYVCILGYRDLKVQWIPKGAVFEIEEYDGSETVHEIGSRSYMIA